MGTTTVGAGEHEIPQWFYKSSRGLPFCLKVGERTWLSDGATMILMGHGALTRPMREPSNRTAAEKGATTILAGVPKTMATVGTAYVTVGGSTGRSADYRCRVSMSVVVLRYVAMVEQLFPGCRWMADPKDVLAPVFAIIGSIIVAVVMPTREGALS